MEENQHTIKITGKYIFNKQKLEYKRSDYIQERIAGISIVSIFFFVFFCCIFPFSVARAEQLEIIDRIVAVVNDDMISLFELNQMVRPYAERIRTLGYPPDKEDEMLTKVREDILNRLIDQKLTDQEIRRSGITITEKEIDHAIERLTKESNLQKPDDLEKALKKEGLTLDEYRQQIKEQILRSKLLNLEIKSGIVITEEDAKSYYNSHYENYQGEKKYHLRNIIMKVSSFASESDKESIKRRMEDVLSKLKAGESFEKMAKNYSELLAESGGNLGEFNFDELDPSIQNAIKELKEGEFTSVLDTEMGYQIFFVEEITQMEGKTLEQALPEIQEKLFNEILDKKFQSWIEELRKRSHIKIML